MKSRYTIALAAVVALSGSAANAQFANQSADVKAPFEPPKSATPAAPPPVNVGGMMIFIDPVTGKIRQPDAADVNELLSQRPQALQLQTPFVARQVASPIPGGGIGVMLDDSFMNYMVVSKRPDGSLLMDCLPDAKNASAAVANGLRTGEVLQAKGALDVQ